MRTSTRPWPLNSEPPRALETCPRQRRSLSGRLIAERAERVPSLVQPDTTPSKVQELTRDDTSRLSPGGARSRPAQAKSARYSPASRAAGARWRQGARQELAVRVVTLQITLAHLRRWWHPRFRKAGLVWGNDVDGRATRLSAARAQPRAPLHVTPPRLPTAAT